MTLKELKPILEPPFPSVGITFARIWNRDDGSLTEPLDICFLLNNEPDMKIERIAAEGDCLILIEK